MVAASVQGPSSGIIWPFFASCALSSANGKPGFHADGQIARFVLQEAAQLAGGDADIGVFDAAGHQAFGIATYKFDGAPAGGGRSERIAQILGPPRFKQLRQEFTLARRPYCFGASGCAGCLGASGCAGVSGASTSLKVMVASAEYFL